MKLTLSELINHLQYLERQGVSPNAPILFFEGERVAEGLELHIAGHVVLEQTGLDRPGMGDFTLGDVQVSR